MTQLLYKTKQFFFVLIKLSIVAAAGYFIYSKLIESTYLSFSNFVDILLKNRLFSLKNSIALLLLSTCNWLLEIWKWQLLVGHVKPISFKNATEQSLGALTASLFTPIRIGEYGAKVLYFETIYRKKIALINLIGNTLQMFATVVFGCIGISTLANTYPLGIAYNHVTFVLILVLIVALTIVMFGKSAFKFKGIPYLNLKIFLMTYPRDRLFKSATLSVMRYIVFSFQFYIILRFFNVGLGYFNAMACITTTYFIASVVPSIFMFDAVIKGSVAVYLFSFLNVEPLIIISATTLMWLLNFAVPACIGSYYVLNFKFAKTN